MVVVPVALPNSILCNVMFCGAVPPAFAKVTVVEVAPVTFAKMAKSSVVATFVVPGAQPVDQSAEVSHVPELMEIQLPEQVEPAISKTTLVFE